MALALQPSPSSRKQIILSLSGTNGTVIYTVPAGKTCTGTLYGLGSTAKIGAVSVTIGASGAPAAWPITLIAGTVVKSTATEAVFIGVEQ